MAISDPMVTPRAEQLLECLRTEIRQVRRPPASVCLRVGELVPMLVSLHDDECCSGLAWVRVASVFPADPQNFPEQQTAPLGPRSAPLVWAIELEMGAARCIPTPDASELISCNEWTRVTHEVHDDAAAMRRALCCFIEARQPAPGVRSGDVIPGTWLPLPVEGRCVGGTMSVTVRGPNCECP